MAAVTADITLDGLALNESFFQRPESPSAYTTALDSPVRIIDPATPAPYGHRNNQIHMFDVLGLYLIEDHATGLIESATFVLWKEEAVFQPAREFPGDLTIGGVRFFPGMEEKDYSGGTITFDGPRLGLWSSRRDGVWIGLDVKGIRQPNGRRSTRKRFVSVSICFS